MPVHVTSVIDLTPLYKLHRKNSLSREIPVDLWDLVQRRANIPQVIL